MAFEIGQNVGPYRIVQQLGQGGMATVYKAYHANLDRYVAIKVLHVAFREDASFLERFQREAQIVAKLEHSHIVPIYDYAQLENQPYLVMKFIEGETLKQRMRKQPPNLQEVTRILSAVASALDYAHQNDVLHRDVKPSNVVLDKNHVPYLTDFGLARIASTGESTLSQDMMLGTPQYISPEQAQGNQVLDAGTDIYSLGVVLYELVVGRVPFSADTPYAIIHDHIYKPLPMPSIVNPSVPIQVEQVLLKALAKNREDRYLSAGALAEAFDAAVDSSQMKEISLHTLRPEAFQTVASQPAPSYSEAPPSQPQMVQSIPLPTTTPTPTPTPMIPPGSVVVPGAFPHQQRRTGWIWGVGGCMVFILTCLLSVGVVIAAINSADRKDAAATSLTFDEQLLSEARSGNLTVVQAEQYVADYPDSASVYFALMLAQLEAGQEPTAPQLFWRTIQQTEPSATLIVQWAEAMSVKGYHSQAVLYYLAAMSQDPQNAALRNQGGQYIYTRASQATRLEVMRFCELASQFPNHAFTEAMIAQATLSITPRPAQAPITTICSAIDQGETIEQVIQHSIELNPTLAEAYLVMGNYYERLGDRSQAVENWEKAISFDDTPEWVNTRVQEKLRQETEE